MCFVLWQPSKHYGFEKLFVAIINFKVISSKIIAKMESRQRTPNVTRYAPELKHVYLFIFFH